MGGLCARRAAEAHEERQQACTQAVSAEHLVALGVRQKRFGQAMHELGRLRKQGLEPRPCMTAAERWEWLAMRKVRARSFKADQTLLECLKRDREAELRR